MGSSFFLCNCSFTLTLSLSLSLTLTLSLSHSLSLTLTHSLLTHSHSLSLTHSPSLTHSHSLTHPHSLTHSHSTLTHTLTLTHILLCGRRGTWCSARGRMYALASLGLRCFLRGGRSTCCSARGSDVRPSVPWSSAALPVAFAWQAQHLLFLQGVGCMPWRPLVSAAFCMAGAALAALQGVGCTPWRPLVSAALPVTFALRGRRCTWCSARGRMYARASLGLRCFCVAGAALAALQGVGCTP